MASTVTRKRLRATAKTRVADMTTDELRAMIEKLIDRKLARLTPASNQTPELRITTQMRQRALSAVGRFHSGHRDISANHDEYLTTSYLG